ncbi:IS5 family transposase [Salidesulfovibrio brasiliensis]|uniref:IS5 family transposase n=1 Tax=Salidesulfovibrio brasiliensis TaxID=221711 RepID=UPI0006CF3DA7
MARRIPWGRFEEEFAELYSDQGRPAKPTRLMVGLMLPKQLENLSDERVLEAWTQNPYYQVFCVMTEFQWSLSCDPTDLIYFRKRVGKGGARQILNGSV